MNKNQLDNISIVAAEFQTAGRGQGDHTWLSENAQNLLFSILLKNLDIPVKDGFALSTITALSVIKTLSNYGIEAKIKLPNDIYVGDKKICGLLIEHSIRGSKFSHSIIGVGLNINQTTFDPSLPNPTSMKLINGQEYAPKEVLEEFMKYFMQMFEEYKKSGDIDSLRLEFDKLTLSLQK